MIRKKGKRLLTGILCVALLLSETAFVDIRAFAAQTSVSIAAENTTEEGEETPETKPEEGEGNPETKPEEEEGNPEMKPEEEEGNPETKPGGEEGSPETKPEEEEGNPDDIDSPETPEKTGDAKYSSDELLEMGVYDRLAAMKSAGDIASGVDKNIAWVIDRTGKLTAIGKGDYSIVQGYGAQPPWYGYEEIRTAEVIIKDITRTTRMFHRCSKMKSVDLSGLDTSKVDVMDQMFADCSSLSSIDVSGFDTGKVLNMQEMFWNCTDLTSIDVSGFDTSQVTNMTGLFGNCSGLSSVDVSGFDTSQVKNMGSMFYGCSGLSSIDVSGLDTSLVENMAKMFEGCSSLRSIDLSGLDTRWLAYTGNMFAGCSSLSDINLSGLDTGELKDMQSMFHGCSSLSGIDLSGFDTSQVTRMDYMFSGCSGLSSIDLSSFNTSQVTRMENMFANCSGLSSLDLSSFDTSQVTLMYGMFYCCSSLNSIDLSSFYTVKVERMDFMFENCSSLSSLDLSSFSGGAVMTEMLNGCTNLEMIRTPRNVKSGPVLPKKESDDKWYMPDGTIVTKLPANLSDSVTVRRNRIPDDLPTDITVRNITINQKGKAYANFILKNNMGDVQKEREVHYTFEGYPGDFAAKSDKEGRIALASPDLEYKPGTEDKRVIKTKRMELDCGAGKTEVLDYGVTMEVTLIPLSFTQTWELGVEGTIAAEVGPGVSVGALKASVAKAKISGTKGGTLSVEHSLQNGTRTLTLLQSYNTDVAAGLELGPCAEAKVVEPVDANVLTAGAEVGVGGTTGIGLVLEDYDPTNMDQLSRVGKFMLASQAQAGGNVFLLKAAEYLTEEQFYDLEQAGANIHAGVGADVGRISFGKAAEGSLLSSEANVNIAYDQTGNRKDFSKQMAFSIEAEVDRGTGDLEIGKLETNIFSASANGMDMLELGAELDAYNRLQGFSVTKQGMTDAGADAVGARRIDAVKVTYGPGAVEQLMENIGVVKDFAAGSTQYVLGDAQQELFERLDATSLEGDYSATVTNERYVDVNAGAGIQLGAGMEVDIGFEGVASCEYETEGGVYAEGRKETANTNEIEAAIETEIKNYRIGKLLSEALEAITDKLLESWDDVSGRIEEAVKKECAELKQSFDEVAAQAENWVLHVVGIKQDKTRQAGAESYSITAYRTNTAFAAGQDADMEAAEYVVQTVGEPYCVYVTDEKGNEVSDYSVNPLTLTLSYTGEMLAAAGLDETQAGRIAVYQYSNEFCGYVCVGGTVDTVAKKVSLEITKPGQYILAADGAAPVVKSFTVSQNTDKPLIEAVFFETSGFQEFSMKLDGEEVIGAANWKAHYNKARNSFSYQVEQALSDGDHICSVYAVDTAGNAMAAPCEIEFEIAMDHGDVPDEDIPTGGVIPKGIWAAGISDSVYTGANITQDFRLYDGRKLLKEKTDYTVSYKNNKSAYTYEEKDYNAFENTLKQTGKSEKTGTFDPKKAPCAVIKMKGNYSGSKNVYFQIEPANIAAAEWEADKLTATYTGKKQTPTPKIVWNGKNLKYGTDFYIPEYDQKKSDKNAFKDPAEYALTLTGKNNYTGEIPVVLIISKSAKQIAMNRVTVKGISNVPWTGKQIVQTGFSIKYGSKTLSENGDYTVTWGINKDVGTGTVTFTGTGLDADGDGQSYVGVKRVSFKITGTPVSKAVVTGVDSAYTYTGKDVKPEAKLTYQGNELKKDVHYTVSYQKNREKGTATILFTGLAGGGYTGTKKQTFKIQQSDMSGLGLAFKDAQNGESFTAPYMKGGAKPEVIVTFDGQTLVQDKDYKISYANNKKMASVTDNKPPTVTVKGKGNFKGSKSLTFAVAAKPLTNENGITVVAKDKAVSNKANGYRQGFKVYDADGKALGSGDYEKNTAVYTLLSTRNADGTETEVNKVLENTDLVPADSMIRITVKGKGAYAGGEATGTYRIVKAGYDISRSTIKINDQDYTGKPVQIRKQNQFVPDKVFVKIGNEKKTLTLGKDIEVVPGSYVKNVNKGTAKVTFRGIDDFGGTKTVSFRIGSRPIADFWRGIYTKATKLFGI